MVDLLWGPICEAGGTCAILIEVSIEVPLYDIKRTYEKYPTCKVAGRTHMTKRKTIITKDQLTTIKENLLSVFHKKAKTDITTSEEKTARDMDGVHSPVFHGGKPEFEGLTREKAKEALAKSIEEKIERVSKIELSPIQIDERERERQRALATERIESRRKRRKEKTLEQQETLFTDQGILSNYKSSSVFDIIQPETFPFEGAESVHETIEGQISLDLTQPTEFAPEVCPPVETAAEAYSFEEAVEQCEPVEIEALQEQPEAFQVVQHSLEEGKEGVSTTMDVAIDRIFDLFGKTKKGLLANAITARAFLIENLHKTGERISSCKLVGWMRAKAKAHLAPALLKIKGKLLPLGHTLQLKEAQLSDRMGDFIDILDCLTDKASCSTCKGCARVASRFDQIRDAAERNKKKLLVAFGGSVAVAAGVMLVLGSMTAYEYVYNGKVLGTVKYQEDVYRTIDIIGDKLSYAYNAEVTIDKEKDISFRKVYAGRQELDDKEDILNRLTYMKDMKARGYGIFVDNGLKAILESKESANEILQEIKSTYVRDSESIDYVEIRFAENVTIEEVDTRLGNIKRKEDVMDYMLTGAIEKKIHVVQSGETFSGIAKTYGMKQSELIASNPDVIPEKLSIGQEISLTQVVPVATVQTVEVATYVEQIPFEISYEDTGSMYKGETTVKSRGANGEKEVVAEIIRNNGIEVERKEISSTILSEPVSQVVLQGTKDPPPLIGTGSFVYPTRGRLSSGYGTRWGRLHAGIDLAAATGTKIVAADGGKVIFSGYNGALGYMVKIDHGGGRVTVYGHCSKLHVKVGERVYQGQHIANVGNTGRSTGPHLHFEVHINGKTKNPLNYL